eukprot:CAMPEP_0183577798 /NCGR_PEP_ID=MMETSP0371-20130417/140511_1 /TAXON_ID=268820 /ORGANISM="Peridinium aciculiferum, Strain PAER-2" /LENGTH=38 /DNA_ID= /DNA_START= /DNA_END= /DNA_ORIENTATION=
MWMNVDTRSTTCHPMPSASLDGHCEQQVVIVSVSPWSS